MSLIKKLVTAFAAISILAGGCTPKPNQDKASLETITSTILENAEKSKVVFFGEQHYESLDHEGRVKVPLEEDNQYAISLLPKLKERGYTHFAVEIDTHEQSLIDNYLSGKINREELDKKLEVISDFVWRRSRHKNRYNLHIYLEIIEAAHKLGYTIVCYDERPHRLTAPGDTTSATPGTERNKAEFENLKPLLDDEKVKMVIYGGSAHVFEKEMSWRNRTEIPLGMLLEEYTKGKSYSVILRGYSDATTGFDLKLSNHPLTKPNN